MRAKTSLLPLGSIQLVYSRVSEDSAQQNKFSVKGRPLKKNLVSYILIPMLSAAEH